MMRMMRWHSRHGELCDQAGDQACRRSRDMLTRERRERGAAMMMCMILITFVGVAVGAMAAHIGADAKRTKYSTADAQVRQLLTFAAIDLQQRLPTQDNDAAIEGPVEFALPRELLNEGATLTATRSITDGGPVQFKITATVGTRAMSQLVTYEKTGDVWKLIAATLDRRAW